MHEDFRISPPESSLSLPPRLRLILTQIVKRTPKPRLGALLLAAALSLLPLPAWADQDLIVSYRVLAVTAVMKGDGFPPLPQGPNTPEVFFDPTFTRDPERTRALNQMLLSQIEEATGRNADAREMLRDNRLLKRFAEMIGEYGLSEDNLADVMTGQLILLWRMAHDLPDAADVSGYQVIGDDMRRILAGSRELGDYGDAEKQTLAVVIARRTIMLLMQYEQAKEAGDAARIARASATARRLGGERMGIDLSKFDISAKGLVAR